MTREIKTLLCLILITLINFSCIDKSKQYRSDNGFVRRAEAFSPNKQFLLLEYQFDLENLGFSRAYWAIIPTEGDYKELELSQFTLPDGYKASEWTDNNELVVEKWVTPYPINKNILLKTGDVYKNVKIVVK